MEDTEYVFEAKTIQRMELLVLSTLQWKMHPVTPLSFIDHIIRRLGLKTHLHWEFLRQCERLLLSVVAGELSIMPLTFPHKRNLFDNYNSIKKENFLISHH